MTRLGQIQSTDGRTNIRGNGEFLANIVLLHVLPMYYLVPHLPAGSKLREYLSPTAWTSGWTYSRMYPHPLKTLKTRHKTYLLAGRITQIASPSGFWARLASPRPTGKNSTVLRNGLNGSSHIYQPSSSISKPLLSIFLFVSDLLCEAD